MALKSIQDWQSFVLLLVDVQEDFWTAEMAQHFPDFSDNVRGLLLYCRQADLDVVHLRASFQQDQSNWMNRYKLQGAIPCIAESDGAQVMPCAVSLPNETVFEKQTFDGFLNPQLEQYLQENGKKFVLVAGLESSVCVLLTAVSATQRGYLSAIISDCSADNVKAHQHTITNYPFAFDSVSYKALPKQYATWCSMLNQLESME